MNNKNRDKRIGTLWEPVNAMPEEMALACMEGPQKKKWDYLTKDNPPQNDEVEESAKDV